MLELIRKCKHCGREFTGTPLAFAENPFCASCLPARLEMVGGPARERAWRREGRYFVLKEEGARIPSSNGRARRRE